MLRLLFRLIVQRLNENRLKRLALRQQRENNQRKLVKKRFFLLGIGVVVTGFIAFILFKQHTLNNPLLYKEPEHAELLVHIESVQIPPLILYLEKWPPTITEIIVTGNVSRIVINQSRFIPTFQLVTAGSTIEIVNEDSILHNAHIIDENDTVFNVATPLKSVRVRKSLTATGMLSVTCDLHPFMHSWIFVPPNPHYVIVNASATRQFTEIDPGEYRLRIWEAGRIILERFLRFSPGENKSLTHSRPA